MKIFVSFSSKDRAVAEMIAESLKGAGHRVFFDQDSLPPGDSYDLQIEQAVAESDCMIFCLSVNSIRPSSYALSELRYARKRWPSAKGKVLPVIVGQVDFENVPAYLKAVTALRPEGNVAAETTSAIEELRSKNGARIKWIASVVLVVAAVSAFGIWVRPPADILFSVNMHPLGDPDLFGRGSQFEIKGTFRNPKETSQFFTGVEVDFDPPLSSHRFDVDLESQRLELRPGSDVPFEGKLHLETASPPAGTRWRVRFLTESEAYAGEWMTWTTPVPVLRFENLADGYSERVRQSVGSSDGFHTLCTSPPEICRLDLTGKVVASSILDGKATALATFGKRLVVAISHPPALLEFTADDLRLIRRHPIKELTNSYNERISTSVRNLAFNAEYCWLATDNNAGAESLLRYEWEGGDWFVDSSHTASPDDLVLKTSDAGEIAGVSAETSPTSFYRFENKEIFDYKGHEFGSISSANDFAWTSQDSILFRHEDSRICLGQFSLGRFVVVLAGPVVSRPWEAVHQMGEWADYRIAGRFERGIIALNRSSGGKAERTEILMFDDESATTLIDQRQARISSLALAGNVGIATIESSNGLFRTILITVPDAH
jgi:hypothetical protein